MTSAPTKLRVAFSRQDQSPWLDMLVLRLQDPSSRIRELELVDIKPRTLTQLCSSVLKQPFNAITKLELYLTGGFGEQDALRELCTTLICPECCVCDVALIPSGEQTNVLRKMVGAMLRRVLDDAQNKLTRLKIGQLAVEGYEDIVHAVTHENCRLTCLSFEFDEALSTEMRRDILDKLLGWKNRRIRLQTIEFSGLGLDDELASCIVPLLIDATTTVQAIVLDELQLCTSTGLDLLTKALTAPENEVKELTIRLSARIGHTPQLLKSVRNILASPNNKLIALHLSTGQASSSMLNYSKALLRTVRKSRLKTFELDGHARFARAISSNWFHILMVLLSVRQVSRLARNRSCWCRLFPASDFVFHIAGVLGWQLDDLIVAGE